MQKPYGYVYLIRNSRNGKIYVGQTVGTIAKRWGEHKSATRGSQGCQYLRRAMIKHGVGTFTIETLASCADQDTLNKLEHYFICTVLHSTNRHIGYNLNGGGDSLGSRHPETIAKIAAKLRGQKRSEECRALLSAMRQNVPAEIRAKISSTLKGRTLSLETRKKMSESRKGRVHAAETRAKMSVAHLGKKMSPEAIVKMAAYRRGKKQSVDAVARRSASNRGRKRTQEQCARIGAAIRASYERRKAESAEGAALTSQG